MYSRTLDPIALLEGAKAKLPHPTSITTEEHYVAENAVSIEDREQVVKIAKLFIGSPYQL